jgi:hypothetical protein
MESALLDNLRHLIGESEALIESSRQVVHELDDRLAAGHGGYSDDGHDQAWRNDSEC